MMKELRANAIERHAIEEMLWIAEQYPQRSIIAMAQRGSIIYGLQNASSDIDYIAITSGKRNHPQGFIGEIDIQFISLENFLRMARESQPNIIDTLLYGRIMIEENYLPLFKSLRFNSFDYIDRSTSHAMQYIQRSADLSLPRHMKSLKTALRNLTMNEMILRHGAYSVRQFDKEMFYAEFERLLCDTRLMSWEERLAETERASLFLAENM